MWWGKTFSPICYTFEVFVVWHVVRHCRGEELGHFCGPVPAASLAVLVHLIELLSILLRCNGFFRIQKVVMDQNGSRLPNSDHDLFFGANLAFGSALELLLSPATELVITSCHTQSTFCHVTIRLRNGLQLLHRIKEDDTSQQWFFWISGQFMRHPLIKLFHPFQFASNAERPLNGWHWVLRQLFV